MYNIQRKKGIKALKLKIRLFEFYRLIIVISTKGAEVIMLARAFNGIDKETNHAHRKKLVWHFAEELSILIRL